MNLSVFLNRQYPRILDIFSLVFLDIFLSDLYILCIVSESGVFSDLSSNDSMFPCLLVSIVLMCLVVWVSVLYLLVCHVVLYF